LEILPKKNKKKEKEGELTKKYFFPCMGVLTFQSFLMAICAIVMATFSTGIDSQSFQVSFYFLFDVTTPQSMQ
jgi:magnesium-transporting ATPase (P-type)